MVKRILHFQGRMGLGGAESFMMNLYRQIDRSKYQFDFLIYDDFENVTDYYEEVKKLGGRFFVVTNPKKNLLKYLIEVNRLLKKESFDIAHNEVYFGGGINLWLAKRNGIKKRIAHSHSVEDGKGNSILLRCLRKYLAWLLLRTATDYLAVSEKAGKSLFHNAPFKVVHNGIDLSLYRTNQELVNETKRELDLNNSSIIIGTVGRLEKEKNHFFLVDVFSVINKLDKNAKLLIIGEGTLRGKLESYIDEKGLSGVIFLLGNRRDIPDLLGVLDVFVMTSYYEGLPMSALEAQASGKKLILSNGVSKETKLTPNVSFISLDTPKTEWAHKILEKPFGNEMTKELNSYSVDYTLQQMMKIYESTE